MLYVLRARGISFLVAVIALLITAGCSQREKKMDETILDAVTDRPHYTPPAPDHPVESPDLKSVYFDYNKSTLTSSAKDALRFNAEWIKAHPGIKVQVEGHCDDRGTQDYNLPLGERRAQSAMQYLIDLGIEADRISTVSYGKEGADGRTEKGRAQNRRAGFYVIFEQTPSAPQPE